VATDPVDSASDSDSDSGGVAELNHPNILTTIQNLNLLYVACGTLHSSAFKVWLYTIFMISELFTQPASLESGLKRVPRFDSRKLERVGRRSLCYALQIYVIYLTWPWMTSSLRRNAVSSFESSGVATSYQQCEAHNAILGYVEYATENDVVHAKMLGDTSLLALGARMSEKLLRDPAQPVCVSAPEFCVTQAALGYLNEAQQLVMLFNPELADGSRAMVELEETSVFCPELPPRVVIRHQKINVRYRDAAWQEVVFKATGPLA
jgi:hypothetical protein